ncbi:hypothetical protein FCOL_05410 [Flavobacterium columnare ATCC 49512]|uniref:Uncharacterized protein n=1 Tax=Flavobacterium columnare (strain ATCC 49512 / CIP 103533 / TG 44/87) TaxID=1041826 RepID=G8X9G0_FLACA|nr:hypothetical protein [Flavobacterium columnare]AEW85907.1 hypothetical protein FCOL_05410 [Flavobacterium columnare ATCC 49512]
MNTKIQDVKKEIGEFLKNNPTIITAGVYSSEITMNKYTKPITAVKGKFPQFHSIMSNVVQGFSTEWTALGQASLKSKKLENYHQKVNFPLIPQDILNSYLAEMYVEGKKADEHPFSKYIIEELMAKVVDDLEELSQTAEYNQATASGNYGSSLNGISKVVQLAKANTEHPAYKIPLNVITPANILDEVKSFEKKLPKKVRGKIKKIFMSENLLLTYADQYEQHYGTKVTYTDADTVKTPLLKKELVGLPNIPDSLIFATVEGNMVRLIDVFDKPQVTDLQIQDYVLKIFMEFWLGYDFLINELVYVASFDASPKGLGNATLNNLYYKSENL